MRRDQGLPGLRAAWANCDVQAHPVSQDRWRASTHRLVTLVRAGAISIDGNSSSGPADDGRAGSREKTFIHRS